MTAAERRKAMTPAEIEAERGVTASPDFIALTRNPKLPQPEKVVRTSKASGDIVIVSEAMARRFAGARGAGEQAGRK